MKTKKDFKLDETFALLLVGEPKTGKTRIAFGFPGLYFLDCGMNLSSAVRAEPEKEFLFDTLSIDDSDKDVPIEKQWSRAIECVKRAALLLEVETIVVDDLSVLSEALIAHIMHQVKIQEGKTLAHLRIQDYQTVKALMSRFVSMLRATRRKVVVTTHQKADKDDLTGTLRYALLIPGQLAHNLGGYFSDVWGTMTRPGAGSPKYIIAIKPSGLHISLGCSTDMPAQVDVTGLAPNQIWAKLKELRSET